MLWNRRGVTFLLALGFLALTVPAVQAVAAEPLRVIMIGAHPDDAEYCGGGTAALWAAAGAKVQLVSVTNGDAGHQSQGGGALASRRAAEATRASKVLGTSWRTLGFHDGELEPSLEVRKAVIRAIREWQADIVILPRPNDYHPDHRYTAQVVQDAAYMVMVPNVCPETPRLEKNPVFMYFEDGFKKPIPFQADVVVDISAVEEQKLKALAEMDSQMFEWLPWIDGQLDQVPADPAGRWEWFVKGWGRGKAGKDNRHYGMLAERYGAERAGKVTHAEAFEICEFGRQPSREELWQLFPK